MAGALAGCAPAGLYYTLTAAKYGPGLLQPPRLATPAKLKHLHLKLRSGAACSALRAGYDGNALFGFAWTLEHRRLDVALAPKLRRFRVNLPVPLLRGIQRLQTTLATAAGAGCLTPAAAHSLLRRITTNATLDPGLAQQIILGAYDTQGYIDIGGPVELDLTYALNQHQPKRYDLGFVARRYRFRTHDRQGRGWLQLRATQVHDAPKPRHVPPAPIALPVAGPPVYLRLFFYLRIAPNQHDVALVAARTHTALARATAILHHHPRSCAAMHVAGVRCTVSPENDTLQAGIAVTVQGTPAAAPLPGSVRQALNAAGFFDTDKIALTLRVLRPFHGRLVPVRAASPGGLLHLILSGGERISW